jgi:TatD DNase family protein
LSPVPFRGKRNEPSYTAHTAEVGAKIYGVDYKTFANQTTKNFNRLFSKAAI